MVKVSIIVIFYNDHVVTEKCLQSLLKTNYRDFEIILVDNASTDGSGTYFRKKYGRLKKVKVVRNDVNGYVSGGYNFGAKLASGEWLFFSNNDVVFDRNWLSNMIFDEKVVCQPKIMDYYRKRIVQSFGGRYIFPGFGTGYSPNRTDSLEFRKNVDVDYVQAEMLINRKLFRKLGGFDSRFVTHYEDVDLSLRAQKMGARLSVCGKSKVYHMVGFTYRKNDAGDLITYHIHKNAILTLKKNFDGVDRILRLTILYLMEIGYVALLFALFRQRKARAIIKSLRYTLG